MASDDLIARARKLVAEAAKPNPPPSGRGRGAAIVHLGQMALGKAAPTLIAELADALEEARRCRTCGGWGWMGCRVTAIPHPADNSTAVVGVASRATCPDCNGTGRDR